jgi:hypothetical protein
MTIQYATKSLEAHPALSMTGLEAIGTKGWSSSRTKGWLWGDTAPPLRTNHERADN